MKFRNSCIVLKGVLRISVLCSTHVGGSQEDAWKSWHSCWDVCHLQILRYLSGAAAEEKWLHLFYFANLNLVPLYKETEKCNFQISSPAIKGGHLEGWSLERWEISVPLWGFRCQVPTLFSLWASALCYGTISAEPVTSWRFPGFRYLNFLQSISSLFILGIFDSLASLSSNHCLSISQWT